ncbi:MAG TPA: TonB-dependent receptor [Gammaproteobacteria bacterium]|nr:TonB-dependent receptor [Gammaproteobacteria bacterium]
MTRRFCAAALGLLLAGHSGFLFAKGPAESDLSLSYGNQQFVSIATGTRQPISQAPAVASVITRQDILRTGATNLAEALEAVPGVHVSVSSAGYIPIIQIRGITSEFNPRVLVLINGIPITNAFLGNRGQVWPGLPVHDIQRIEVIRGPGSALYGADAYAGVINVITRGPDDIHGTETGARAGSYGTEEGWGLHSGWLGPVHYAASVDLLHTRGPHPTIRRDAQTALDRLMGTSASLAPGSVNLGKRRGEARLDFKLDHWRLRMGYLGSRDQGVGAGGNEALDPAGKASSDRYDADLTWHDPALTRNWGLKTQVSYFQVANRTDLVLFPPGATFPNGQTFPNGVIGDPHVYERHTRLDVVGLYSGWPGQTWRIGSGVSHENLYRATERKNYTLDPGGFPVPLPGGLVDVTNTDPFIRPHDRYVSYLFLQDEWGFARDWDLTAGVRYDHYTDWGKTVNPRLALVWQTRYNLTTKFLYGRAFRAPSFAEQYNINNPIALGNPNLNPETIDTYETAFDYQYSASLRGGLNLFYYRMHDLIRFVNDPSSPIARRAQNTGGQDGYGMETEIEWQPLDSYTLRANYAYQHATDERIHHRVGNAPVNEVYIRSDWQFRPEWNADLTIDWVGRRYRSPGDPRPPLGSYTWVDFTLRHALGNSGLELAGSVRNVLNQGAKEPSLLSTGSNVNLPGDLPLPGRNFYVALDWNF